MPKLPPPSESSPDRTTRNIAVLGATGSIGTATVDVIDHLNTVDTESRWRIFAASAHRNLGELTRLVSSADLPPERIVLSDPERARGQWPEQLRPFSDRISVGPEALVAAASAPEVDVVVAGIVGRAGLESTIAAVQAGKRVALANKETLVVAGPIVRRLAARSGAELLPVDSEHSAIFQCLGDAPRDDVRRLILTASGGPLWGLTAAEMESATPEQALAHPTWDMGPKISVDSATMMNKALEVIEARWLFDVPADKIDVVVHPQSMIHSMVEYNDGSVLAQLSPPDMRLPIQYALTYPRRLASVCERFDGTAAHDWAIRPVDRERFPAIELGFRVAADGGTAGVVVNGANEEAVGLFLEGKIRFTNIVDGCRTVLENHTYDASPDLSRLLELDRWSRRELRRVCSQG